MCGRYGLAADEKTLLDRYELPSEMVGFKPRYNIAPTQNLPVITNQDKKKIEIMKWGLIPFWAKDIRIGQKMINARAEGIESKPSFRKPIKSQRCLVPASYFFEWMRTEEGKVPYLIRVKDEDVFSFAGLYDEVIDAEGKPLRSFTIITTEPNSLMSKIHNRMPVILKKEDEAKWLNPDLTETDEILKFLKPYSANDMEAYVVSNLVNSPANDYEDLIKPDVNSL
jgi:putative SOS response-associated peptidase YedK